MTNQSRALHSIRCTECGTVLAYSIQPLPETSCMCQICTENFCKVVELFAIPNLPRLSDLYPLTKFNGNVGEFGIRHKWNMAVEENVNYLHSCRNLLDTNN